MKKSVLGVLLGLLGISLTVMAVEKNSIPDGMALPEYNEKGHLVRPEGYREWVFVGASYGLSYTEGASDKKVFHHVYIQPEAYRQYRDEGTFPKMVCFDCHAQHAKDDNVFVQFYPALKELKFGKSGKFEDEK